jgi:hypothetical protein
MKGFTAADHGDVQDHNLTDTDFQLRIRAFKPSRTGISTHQEDVETDDAERIAFINQAFRDYLVERQRRRVEVVETAICKSLEALRVQGRASRQQTCPSCKQSFVAYKKKSGNCWPTYCGFCAPRVNYPRSRRKE